VKFVHVDDLAGYKSGALNLVLREYTDPGAELVGVVDADYLIDPQFLRKVAGYFADPGVGFVQGPQDYREYENDRYLTACYDAYRYFFTTTMPSRNERNSIIFAGTMGLLRKSALEKLGGWDEWCITEDAETSLRLLKAGYSGVYVPESMGRGIMPLTFASFKSQRFRWCFGGMQILRRHWRDLVPWNRDPANHLTMPQRLDYFLGSVQWLNDLVYLGFTAILLVTAALLWSNSSIRLRPLIGAAVLLPATLIATGLIRALWAVRIRTGVGLKRAVLAFTNWLSMSWTVAMACVQGLIRSKGVFMRTPKSAEDGGVASALWAARTETVIAAALWTAPLVLAVRGIGESFVFALFVWQGIVYASAPFMSWLNQLTRLPEPLERRRRSEWLRERLARRLAYSAGVAAVVGALAAFALVVGIGGSHPGANLSNPFSVPKAGPGDHGPISNLISGGPAAAGPSPAVPSPSVSPSPVPSLSPSPSPSPSPVPTTASPTPT
jgi:hypothetical protein